MLGKNPCCGQESQRINVHLQAVQGRLWFGVLNSRYFTRGKDSSMCVWVVKSVHLREQKAKGVNRSAMLLFDQTPHLCFAGLMQERVKAAESQYECV